MSFSILLHKILRFNLHLARLAGKSIVGIHNIWNSELGTPFLSPLLKSKRGLHVSLLFLYPSNGLLLRKLFYHAFHRRLTRNLSSSS